METVAGFWFRKRAQTAVDARLAYRALESRLENDSPLVDILGTLVAELARPVNHERGIGFGAETLAVAREQILRGRSISADQILADLVLARRMQLLVEDQRVADGLRQLTAIFNVRGKQVHDANLVATATAHGIGDLVTANVADFQRFGNLIAVVDLAAIAV